jgi:hypothetical protein
VVCDPQAPRRGAVDQPDVERAEEHHAQLGQVLEELVMRLDVGDVVHHVGPDEERAGDSNRHKADREDDERSRTQQGGPVSQPDGK